MSLAYDLKQLIVTDPDITFDFVRVENDKDPNHVVRKQQQRAICNEAILVCLKHGVRKRTYNDFSYTITDRSLRGTKYEKYIDKLRGLSVIGCWQDNVFLVITTFWNFNVKSRKRF